MTAHPDNSELPEELKQALGFAIAHGTYMNDEARESKFNELCAALQTEMDRARLSERKDVALDNYQGQTFSDSTNWKAKFEKFIENNERRITHLKANLGEGENNA